MKIPIIIKGNKIQMIINIIPPINIKISKIIPAKITHILTKAPIILEMALKVKAEKLYLSSNPFL